MFKKIYRIKLLCGGQSILEIVVALGIFVIIIAALTSLVLGSFTLLERSSQLTRAEGLVQEGVEAVRSIQDRAWNELIYSRSAVATSSNQWGLAGEGTTEQVGSFSRTIDFLSVYRDSNGNIVSATSSGAYLDVLSKQVVVNISWEIREGASSTLARTTYFTNWNASVWEQTNWSGGSGQLIWSNNSEYYSDDNNIYVGTSGQAELKEIATSTYASSGFLISSAFDTSQQSAFNTIVWEEVIPGGCPTCAIQLQIKTAPDSGGAPGTWSATWSGPDGEDGDEEDYFTVSTGEFIHTDHNNDQWVKYRAVLVGDGSSTPVMEEIKLYYQ